MSKPTAELVEIACRVIAPFMEGGREFDQMPPDRIALRKWCREGMCSTNDATQDDALEAATAVLAAVTPQIEARARLEGSKAMQERRKYPVLGTQGQAKVDWQFVEDHAKQAYENHRQTVERLAERGGLSWSELCAVVQDRKWSKMETADAIEQVRAAEARYLTTLDPTQIAKDAAP